MPAPTTIEEIARRAGEGFAPLISAAPSFVAWYLAHRERDVLMSFTVFRDRAGAEASTERAAQWIRQELGDLLPNPPIVTGGTVVAQASEVAPAG